MRRKHSIAVRYQFEFDVHGLNGLIKHLFYLEIWCGFYVGIPLILCLFKFLVAVYSFFSISGAIEIWNENRVKKMSKWQILWMPNAQNIWQNDRKASQHTHNLGWQHIHDIRNCWLPKSQSLMAWNSNGINYLFTLRLYKSVDILLLLSTLISVFIRFAMLTSDDDEYIVSIDFVCRTCNVSYLFDSFTVCVFFVCLGYYTGWRETSRKWIVRFEFISIILKTFRN